MPAEPAAKPPETCPYCGADHGEATLRCPATDMVLPLAGRLLAGKFRLLSELGRGGMGAVWRARNIHVERDVALKLILPEVLKNPEIVARFRDEARVAARIGHAGICDILDFELTPLGPVIVMELLRGENLGERISRQGRLPVGFAVAIICQALVALEAAHRAGIIHRDLKPENLFLHQLDGAPMIVKLMDFGISKFTDRASGLTGSGVIMGTPEYMAPEQVSGAANADERTDIWAIGAVLYKALTGEDAFTGVSVPAILLAITTGTPAPLSSHAEAIPPALSAIVLRCLHRDSARRYQSARELAEALKPFAAASLDPILVGTMPTLHSDITAATLLPPPVRRDAPATGHRRARWPQWLLGLGLLGLAGYGTWRYASERPELARAELARAAPDEAPKLLPASSDTPATAGVARQANPDTPGLLALWGLLDRDVSDGVTTRTRAWLSAGMDELAAGLARPPVEPSPEPATPDTPEPTTPTPTTGTAEPTTPTPTTGTAEPTTPTPTTGTAEPTTPSPTAGDPEPTPEPGEPGSKPPEPPRLISAGAYVTPSVAGKPGNQHWAKEYCAALDRNKFLGIDRWKLANPAEARSFANVAGVKPGSYWTTANHRGVGLVVSLPRGTDRSVASRKKTARPLCVASKS